MIAGSLLTSNVDSGASGAPPKMSSLKRSSAVPLTLVPALAAVVGCGPSQPSAAEADPCLPATYQQQICEQAVRQQGYHYGGGWYPHVYAMPALFYYNGYSRYVARGGRVRAVSPSTYSPTIGGGGVSTPRTTVVRGGFGGIGGAHGGFAGS
jgi:hypothetical protein